MKRAPKYILELTPLASDVPEIVRLRRLLKVILRAFRFRAVIREVTN